jgi:hypothetical protein
LIQQPSSQDSPVPNLQIVVALPDPHLCRCRRCGVKFGCASAAREASHLAEVRASYSVQTFVHSVYDDSSDLLALLRAPMLGSNAWCAARRSRRCIYRQ